MAKDTDVVNPAPTIEDLPDTQIAGTPAGQPLDQAASSAVTLEEVEKLIQKQFQSMKDTRLGKMETQIGDMEGAIAKYEALKGGTVDPKALGKLQSDQENQDLKARLEILESGNVVAPSAGAGEPSWAEKQATILDKAGIDKNDPRIAELLRTSESKQDFVVSLEEQTFAWKQEDAKKPQPSLGTVAQIIPSVVAEKGALDAYNDEQLGDKLVDLLREPSKHKEEIELLDKELQARDAKKR